MSSQEQKILAEANKIRPHVNDEFDEPEESTDYDPHNEYMTFGEIKILDIQTDWLMEKLIPLGGITTLVGFTGYGKSTLVYQMATAIVRKKKLFGLKMAEMETIWYLDYENALSILKGYGVRLDVDDRVRRLPKKDGKPLPKLDGAGWEFIKKFNEKTVVIVDSAQASIYGTINDERNASTLMKNLKEAREATGATIILLHHTPAGNKNKFKGSTAVVDQVDQYLLINRKPKEPGLIKEVDLIIEDPNDPANDPNKWFYRFGTKGEGSRCEPHFLHLNFDPTIGFVKMDDVEFQEILVSFTEHKRNQSRGRSTNRQSFEDLQGELKEF